MGTQLAGGVIPPDITPESHDTQEPDVVLTPAWWAPVSSGSESDSEGCVRKCFVSSRIMLAVECNISTVGGVIPGAGGGGMFGEGAQLAGDVFSRLGTPASYEDSEEPQLFGVLGSEGSKRICCFASCTTSVAVKHRVVDASRASPPVSSLEGQAPLVVSSGTPLHDMTDVEGVILGVPELVVVSTETLNDM